MKRSRPWFKLSTQYFENPRIWGAGCAAVYPWVIARLRQVRNAADDDDLNADCCARYLGLSADVAKAQIEAMKGAGLIERGPDGLWRDPAWEEVSPDSRPHSRKRQGSANEESWPPHADGDDSIPPKAKAKRAEKPASGRAHAPAPTREILDPRSEILDPRSPSTEVALGSKVSCAGKPDAKPPEANGGIWFKNIIVESTGTQLPTYRNDSEGKRVWNVGALMHVFQRLWPSDPSCDPGGKGNRTLWRFAMELTEKHHPDIIDAAVAKIAPHPALLEPERWNRPYMLKALIEQPPPTPQQQARSGSRSGQPRGDVRAEAQAAQLAKYRSQAEGRTDDGELHELAKDYLAANEAPSEQFRLLLTDFYRRKGWPLPPLFAPPGAA